MFMRRNILRGFAVGCAVTAVFMLSGCSAADTIAGLLHSQVSQTDTDTQPTPTPDNSIKYYMYVVNCKTSITLRTEPNVNSAEMTQIPYGTPVGIIADGMNGFYKVSYNGMIGYASSAYLSTVLPAPVQQQPVQQATANVSPRDAEEFVAASLRAFVNGINTGDTSYISWYFTGDEAVQEKKTHDEISGIVLSEQILSLSCHSGTIVSSSRATVVRDSTIRVTYDDGRVKDVTESYLYTLQISADGTMRIIELEER